MSLERTFPGYHSRQNSVLSEEEEKKIARVSAFLLVVVVMTAGSVATAEETAAAKLARERAEMDGVDLAFPTGIEPAVPGTRGLDGTQLPALLLIPESTNDRVMAFDPTTGDLVDADFIPADPDNLSTPICAILNHDGTRVLVSDQLDDVVQAYDVATGAYIGVFAPAGGVNTAILDNIRGISLQVNGNLLVTVGGGANDDAVAEFDTAGNYLGNFIANALGGLGSPFDVHILTEATVGGIDSDAIHRYDVATGAYIADLIAINTFPEQINRAANGNFLIANFSGTQEGIMEVEPDGTLVGIYDEPTLGGYRGVWELPNGNLLVTNGSGVHEMTRSNTLVETKISGVSARFIEYTLESVPVELQGFSVE